MPRSTARKKSAPPIRERKNLRLDQTLLDAAKLALGAQSETEAVTFALQRVVNNKRVAAGLRALGGTRIVIPARVLDGSDAR